MTHSLPRAHTQTTNHNHRLPSSSGAGGQAGRPAHHRQRHRPGAIRGEVIHSPSHPRRFDCWCWLSTHPNPSRPCQANEAPHSPIPTEQNDGGDTGAGQGRDRGGHRARPVRRKAPQRLFFPSLSPAVLRTYHLAYPPSIYLPKFPLNHIASGRQRTWRVSPFSWPPGRGPLSRGRSWWWTAGSSLSRGCEACVSIEEGPRDQPKACVHVASEQKQME